MPIPRSDEAVAPWIQSAHEKKTEEIYYFDNHPGEEEDKANIANFVRFVCVFFETTFALDCLIFFALGQFGLCQIVKSNSTC